MSVLTPFEAETVASMMDDLDPAHFECYPAAERARREAAAARARDKLAALAAKTASRARAER